MALIREVRGYTPEIGNDTWLAETATVIGNVKIGENCSIWYNAVLRGDVNAITIGNNTNIQDGVVIHTLYDGSKNPSQTHIGDYVSVGHNAIIHGGIIEDNCLIGMGATILDNAVVGTGKTYVTVGSNNDNDNHFEKAKISLYNSKKEKTFEKLYNIGYNSSFFGVIVDYEDNSKVYYDVKYMDDNMFYTGENLIYGKSELLEDYMVLYNITNIPPIIEMIEEVLPICVSLLLFNSKSNIIPSGCFVFTYFRCSTEWNTVSIKYSIII